MLPVVSQPSDDNHVIEATELEPLGDYQTYGYSGLHARPQFPAAGGHLLAAFF
jgi:hypothetical protein